MIPECLKEHTMPDLLRRVVETLRRMDKGESFEELLGDGSETMGEAEQCQCTCGRKHEPPPQKESAIEPEEEG